MLNFLNNSNIFIWIEKLITSINSIFFALLLVALSFALILILGIWFKSISIYAIYGMTILMIGAILMHLKVNDPFKKYVPALSILILLATLIINY